MHVTSNVQQTSPETDLIDHHPPDKLFVETLVRKNQRALLCYARSLVHEESTAQDIVQETFLRLCKKPPTHENVRSWLFRVCRTRAVDWWRRQRENTAPSAHNDPKEFRDFFERLPDNTPAPNDALQHGETLGILQRQVETLPARQRELLRLKFQGGLSYKEIANTTGLTVTNVGFILHTALATLRQRVNTSLNNIT
ncbi:MAG: sigma-70 family RNA polymerase sigma factor [Puniceicoccales bacterium]|jgi:RNA polymerase sigma-70 factor (ECF subfamily)|nr:sigma-70 family RNA polymerase sigma factor [Puniceicoccales bacterium]